MMLGNELTLRETVHQVEAFRRIDEAISRVSGYGCMASCYRTYRHSHTIAPGRIEDMLARHTPRRVEALSRANDCSALWALGDVLDLMRNKPQLADIGQVQYEVRGLIKTFVGEVESPHQLQREIARRRAKVHPDYRLDIPYDNVAAHFACNLLHRTYVQLDQVMERPEYQRAVFPRGDRWVGPYTRETALRDLKMAVPVLAYLAVFGLICGLRDMARAIEDLAAQMAVVAVMCGLSMPNANMSQRTALALPGPADA